MTTKNYVFRTNRDPWALFIPVRILSVKPRTWEQEESRVQGRAEVASEGFLQLPVVLTLLQDVHRFV